MSHNSPEYNCYKVYEKNGGQLLTAAANNNVSHINRVENELSISVKQEQEQGLLAEGGLVYVRGEVDADYTEAIKIIQLNRKLVQ
ncbi:hypothetical protein [Priestia aryabhattai]|uniref:hypothetical protein n=1 Tax=Priestia aryabhattai TaxID=412384 RepID=UPI0020411901|nr:hypothetical protein [Priestia aryabhattai]